MGQTTIERDPGFGEIRVLSSLCMEVSNLLDLCLVTLVVTVMYRGCQRKLCRTTEHIHHSNLRLSRLSTYRRYSLRSSKPSESHPTSHQADILASPFLLHFFGLTDLHASPFQLTATLFRHKNKAQEHQHHRSL